MIISPSPTIIVVSFMASTSHHSQYTHNPLLHIRIFGKFFLDLYKQAENPCLPVHILCLYIILANISTHKLIPVRLFIILISSIRVNVLQLFKRTSSRSSSVKRALFLHNLGHYMFKPMPQLMNRCRKSRSSSEQWDTNTYLAQRMSIITTSHHLGSESPSLYRCLNPIRWEHIICPY